MKQDVAAVGAKSELTRASLRPDWHIGARDSDRRLDLLLFRTENGVVIGMKIRLWDLHAVRSWNVGSIAAGSYLDARLVSSRAFRKAARSDLQRLASASNTSYVSAPSNRTFVDPVAYFAKYGS